MTTKSDRNMSLAQFQQMWPGITMTPGETLTVTTTESITAPYHTGGTIKGNPGPELYTTITVPKQEPNTIDGATMIPGNYTLKDGRAYPVRELGPTLIKNTPNLDKLMKTEAVKADSGRADWTLLPFESLEEVVRVLDFGAKKYDKWNWTTSGGFEWTRVARAALNHTFKWLRGEDKDDESGLSHIAHAICNLVFLLHYIQNKEKYNKDNRVAR